MIKQLSWINSNNKFKANYKDKLKSKKKAKRSLQDNNKFHKT